MADGIKISALTEATDAQTVDGNLLETAVVDSSSSTGFSSKKTPISRLANYVLSKFTGLSLGGSARTVKTAIDALQTDVDKKADADGEYDNLTVGTSKQLLSDSYTEDFTPYKFRKSPYTDRLSESIVGASVVWNQLVYYPDNTVTLSRDSQRTASVSTNNVKSVISHIYLIMFDIIADSSNNGIRAQYGAGIQFEQGVGHKSAIMKATGESSYLYVFISNAEASEAEISFKNINIIDLTTMFGTTVADALYAMGADGVSLFKQMFPKDYYAYATPTLEHVYGLQSHDMTVGDKTYSYALDASLTLRGLIKYDATKGFYADGDVYEADGTVTRRYGIVDLGTLTWRRDTNGEYPFFRAKFGSAPAPAMTSGLTTVHSTAYVGSPNRSAANFRAFDNNGKATINTSSGEVLVQDSTYTDAASFKAAMSGVYMVYELATPTTESAEPFDAIQITDGTEEYVSECLAPVGHESKYYANLRSKIEGLPTDFSAIICATEATNKASRNYAVGDYLIYNNTLYKVTTAIATNASLTVGTNITATTIMAEIKALQ